MITLFLSKLFKTIYFIDFEETSLPFLSVHASLNRSEVEMYLHLTILRTMIISQLFLFSLMMHNLRS